MATNPTRAWERHPDDADFLEVRIGLGPLPLATPMRVDRAPSMADPDPIAAYHRSRYGDKIIAERIGGTQAGWGS